MFVFAWLLRVLVNPSAIGRLVETRIKKNGSTPPETGKTAESPGYPQNSELNRIKKYD
jgi:hypothetical protein